MPQSRVAVSRGDGSRDDERSAAPAVTPSPVARSESSDRSRSTAGRERSTADRDWSSAGRERSTADRDWSSAGRERSTADRDWSSAGRERSTADRERSTTGVPGRRTVTIHGHGTERYVPPRSGSSRRRPERRYERAGFRPDRTAMWAVLLGLMLILAAAASAHAATLHTLTHLH